MPLLRPTLMLPAVLAITPELLAARGLVGVVLDADNTLVPRQAYQLDEPTKAWIERLQADGRKLCILSNSHHIRRVAAMVAPYGIPAISLARKPLRSGYRRALKALGTTAAETVMVGDQILTDILGGNLAGLPTILVPPLSGNDFVLYRAMRPFERALIRRWRAQEGAA